MLTSLRNKTIIQQLLLNLLLPVVAVLLAVFFLIFRYNQEKLDETLAQQEKNILEETKNLTFYFDYAMHQHERAFIGPMKQHAYQLRNALQYKDPKQVDLFELSRQLGIDTSFEHIYLIDQRQVIVNTTFKPDLGLDFAKLNSSYITFFNDIRKNNVFKEDRFGLEMKTGKIKKYAFLPTADKRYIIELGSYSEEATAYQDLLLQRISTLKKRFPAFVNVELYLGVKGSPDVRLKDPTFIKGYLRCLEEGKNQQLDIDRPETRFKERWDLFFIPVRDSKLYAGYILAVEINDSQEKQLFRELIWRFSVIFLLSIGSILILMIWRARKIANPIRSLSKQTLSISSDNLNTQVAAGGSSELEQLAANFNKMIHQLKESYESLEEKVIERTKELSEQKKIVEEKNKEILDSIHYARFIQEALLPSSANMQTLFPQNMVLYIPKDIIAGDFYWVEKTNRGHWFAVADCTGHGVPGAMVSVLCVNAMNQTLLEHPLIETGPFLDEVRAKVIQSLNRDASTIKDGMDISAGCFDPATRMLQWSGANNPLWIIRGEELIELKPDKQPIGQYEGASPFNTQSFTCMENDLLIAFSDGYADQFGGPKNKKFKYATLKQLLLDHAAKEPQEIRGILHETFVAWKNDVEQTDDVCIMCIRIA
ncbi:MAG: PP2C family protein-serine/threonine phosphatase [Fluviicola sp.]